MQISDDQIRGLGDKDIKHYYEVLLLQNYWGKDRTEIIPRFEEEMRRRGLMPEEAKRVIMERVPNLDAALDALWTGKLYKRDKEGKPEIPSDS